MHDGLQDAQRFTRYPAVSKVPRALAEVLRHVGLSAAVTEAQDGCDAVSGDAVSADASARPAPRGVFVAPAAAMVHVTQSGSAMYGLATPQSDEDYVVHYLAPTMKLLVEPGLRTRHACHGDGVRIARICECPSTSRCRREYPCA